MSPRDKEILARCYGKCKKSKVKKENAKVVKVIADKAKDTTKEASVATTGEQVGMVDHPKTGSRAQLMEQAKEKGIKYFRILRKEDLVKVLVATPEEATKIIETAKIKWQNGWQKNKEEKHGTKS